MEYQVIKTETGTGQISNKIVYSDKVSDVKSKGPNKKR